MVYVISDIHGCFNEFEKMLEQINFSPEDYMYVIGDCLDKGPYPITTLCYCLDQPNMELLLGNHELFLLDEYKNIQIKKPRLDDDFAIAIYNECVYERYKMSYWADGNGGLSTIREFRELPKEKREKLISEIKKLKPYKEINYNNQDFILVHGGFYQSDFSPQKPLSAYKPWNLVWDRQDPDILYYSDKVCITGHTPTAYYGCDGKIIMRNNNILIDCGCVYGDTLGCLCLDTMQEYYIDSEQK